MTDLKERLRDLDQLEAPDLWLTIVERARAEPRSAAPPATRFGIGRAGMVMATAATLLVALVVGLFASPFGAPASALAVIDRATAQFGEVPPFRAEIVTRLDAEAIAGERPGYRGPDAVVRRILSYAGADQWRRDIVENPVGVLDPAAGSYLVWDGETLGVYHADEEWFQTEPTTSGWDPLGWLSWERADRYWHDACADGDVLADDEVAGRLETHLDCGEFEVWIDAETGLILKQVTFESSEEIVEIAYNVDFDAATFEVTLPAGASLEPPAPQTSLVVGAPAPGWTLMLLGGGELSLEQLAGTSSMVLVWADWCDRSCTDALGHLEDFAAGRSDWRAVSVVIDSSEAVERIVDEHDIILEVAFDDGTVLTEWGVDTVPTLVLLDEHGRVTGVHAGLEIGRELEGLAGER